MNLKCPRILIQNSIKHLIQDHLTQLLLDDLYTLSNFLCDPRQLDGRVWFDDSDQILLEKCVVQNGEM
jgi:hypothetical protein